MIESIKKKTLEIFDLSVVIALVATVCLIEDASCIDHRRHLFMLPDGALQIEDEGFRWRNSFNFNLGAPIINWFFRNGAGFAVHATQANGIHAALSAIVNNVAALPPPPGGAINHVAAAALTIVVQNPNNGNLEVYSEIIRDSAGGLPNAPAVSIPSTGNGYNPLPAHCNAIISVPLSMYYTGVKVPNAIANTRAHVESTANNLIGAQIPLQGGDGHYTCCEGQIVSRLFDTNPPLGADPLFPRVINDLIEEANLPAHHGGAAPAIQITDQHIILVVLHIHSHFDPCAKCSKVLSGLSRQMNMTAAMRNHGMRNLLATADFTGAPPAGIPNLLTRLNAGNARFLIEVSSNMSYIFNGARDIGQICSCAELAGVDANPANPINIPAPGAMNFDINGNIAVNNSLTIPNNSRNWHFPLTFPPYVVYGRVTPEGVVGIPGACAGVHQARPDDMPNLQAVP